HHHHHQQHKQPRSCPNSAALNIPRDRRPLVDRDGSWPALIPKRPGIECAAVDARAARHRRAAQAVAQLIGA
ncbi:MAG: hypothetical protein ABSH36_00660, partial [Solirubrobacteraceae bacterium]